MTYNLENTHQSNLTKLCTQQNKYIRYKFFAGSKESPDIFYKLLDILKFENVVKLVISFIAHKIFSQSSSIPSFFS